MLGEVEQVEESKKASEIEECEDCPLLGNDCPGGWTSGAGGTPIEPPCCSWNGDEEIYEGMYDRDYRFSPQELKWAQEEYDRREAARREKLHKQEIERFKEKVRSLTGGEYRHIEFRRNGSICHDWLCPYCHTWRRVGAESWYGGIGEAWCGKCNRRMVYCAELELRN